MSQNTALKADDVLPRFLTEQRAVYRRVPRGVVRQKVIAEDQDQPDALLAKEELCCDQATD
jgi:hypothetical protein